MTTFTFRVEPLQAKQIGHLLHVDFNKVGLNEFMTGMNKELEHYDTLRRLGIAQKDALKAAGMITLDHLNEDPLYYTHNPRI